MSSRLFPTFSSIKFSASGLMLRSLIYLNLSFVQPDKYRSIFYILSASQISTIYLKCFLFFFSIVYFWLLCKRSSVHKCVALFLCLQFYSIDQLSVSVPTPCSFYHCCSVVQLEVRDGDSFRSSFIVKNYFSHPGFFGFPYIIDNCFFHVFKELYWNFYGNFIESVDCIWQDGHFYCQSYKSMCMEYLFVFCGLL